MAKQNKRTILILLAVALLLCAAEALNRLNNQESLFGTSRSLGMSLLRSDIYLFLLMAWGVYVRHRVTDLTIRRYLSRIVLLMILWLLFRTMKYTLVALVDVKRILWYLYYLPMLFIPVLSLLIGIASDRAQEYRMSKYMRVVVAVTTLLVILVLTNDMHQLVFRFPTDAVVFTDEDPYTYGIGYYLVLVWAALCVLISIAILVIKCRYQKGWKSWLPIVPIVLLFVYCILYVHWAWLIKTFVPDMTVFLCMMIVLSIEGSMMIGLIPTNTHYMELFTAANLPIYLTDNKNRIYAKSARTYHGIVGERYEAQEDRGIRTNAFSIRKGHVYWEEDISHITAINEELEDVNESLEERHALVREEHRMKKEKLRLHEANQLYYQMQVETEPQLVRMQELIVQLGAEADAVTEKEWFRELMIHGTYFKRRNNLLFLSKQNNRVRSAELGYCLGESIYSLAIFGIEGSYFVDSDNSISLHDARVLYDMFYLVLKQVHRALCTIAVIITEQPNRYVMHIDLSTAAEAEGAFPDAFEVEREADYEYVLTYTLEREGGASDAVC